MLLLGLDLFGGQGVGRVVEELGLVEWKGGDSGTGLADGAMMLGVLFRAGGAALALGMLFLGGMGRLLGVAGGVLLGLFRGCFGCMQVFPNLHYILML